MAKIDLTYMRATFKIQKDVPDERITPYIIVASRRLQSWVGANYSSGNQDAQEVLKLAEATLAMHFLTLNLNTSIRPDGLVKTERDSRDVVLSYLSPQETETTAQAYLDQAQELIREFQSDIYIAPGIIGDDDNFEATTRRWRN